MSVASLAKIKQFNLQERQRNKGIGKGIDRYFDIK